MSAAGTPNRCTVLSHPATVQLEAIRPHYRPGSWTPHMTLQIDGNPQQARAIASAIWPAPQPALAIRLDMASFVPVVRLSSVDLTDSG